jgi:hypothetical protein
MQTFHFFQPRHAHYSSFWRKEKGRNFWSERLNVLGGLTQLGNIIPAPRVRVF